MNRPSSNTEQPKRAATVKRPGEILFDEFMRPLGLTAYRVSKELGVAPITVSEILRGLRSISPGMACRLGAFFETHPVYWLALQATYDVHQHQQNGTGHSVAPCRYINGKPLGPAQALQSITLWQQCWICSQASEEERTTASQGPSFATPPHAARGAAIRSRPNRPAVPKKQGASLTSQKNT